MNKSVRGRFGLGLLIDWVEATKYCIHDGKVDESDASEVDVDSDDES